MPQVVVKHWGALSLPELEPLRILTRGETEVCTEGRLSNHLPVNTRYLPVPAERGAGPWFGSGGYRP